MTTTLTIVVILAMLWLAWPRTPKVEPRPSPHNLLACRDAIRQLESNPVFINCVITYSGPPQPLITIKGHP